MKKTLLILTLLLVSIYINSQIANNPFKDAGYDVLMATSSKGEFAEFHDQSNIVEIGSVLYDTKTKQIVKILDKEDFTTVISSPIPALSIDPLCEKYYWISPYTYCANNPIRFIDLRGDSISVAEEHRTQFSSSLNSVFGEHAKGFSYTSTGMLTYSGSTRGMSRDQKIALEGLTSVMNENTITNVVFGESAQVTDNNGNSLTLKASDGGGAVIVLASENPNFSQNTIVVDPSISTLSVNAVTSAYYITPIDPSNGARFESKTVQTNPTDAVFHELGHVVHQGKSQDKVINYNNRVRNIIGLPRRPMDETHNRTVISNNY